MPVSLTPVELYATHLNDQKTTTKSLFRKHGKNGDTIFSVGMEKSHDISLCMFLHLSRLSSPS